MTFEMQNKDTVSYTKYRNSNLELFRILLMLMIIAHHYVVNSGLTEVWSVNDETGNSLFLSLFGWGGKTGINCFILITGYFMCQKNFSWQKLLMLLFEVQFYSTVIYLIFLLSGRPFSWGELKDMILYIPLGIGHGFVGSFIVLYLLIPFVNKLVKAMTKREFQYLLALLIGVYSVVGTFVPFGFYEYIGWYVTVYLVGAYIRLYGIPLIQSRIREVLFMLACLLVVYLSIVGIFYLTRMKGSGLQIWTLYYFVSDSNKILALLSSVSLFLFFKDMRMPHYVWVNKIATATFGVLLIHGNSNAMREWLWRGVLKNVSYFTPPPPCLWIHALLSVLGVYVVCVAIDLLRIRYIERPLFKWIEKRNFRMKDFVGWITR